MFTDYILCKCVLSFKYLSYDVFSHSLHHSILLSTFVSCFAKVYLSPSLKPCEKIATWMDSSERCSRYDITTATDSQGCE